MRDVEFKREKAGKELPQEKCVKKCGEVVTKEEKKYNEVLIIQHGVKK